MIPLHESESFYGSPGRQHKRGDVRERTSLRECDAAINDPTLIGKPDRSRVAANG